MLLGNHGWHVEAALPDDVFGEVHALWDEGLVSDVINVVRPL